MRPAKIEMTAASAADSSAPFPLDWRKKRFNVSLVLSTSGNTTGWTVEYTLDNVWDIPADEVEWLPHPEMSSLTADKYGNLALPVFAIRLTCNANGTDTATLTILQSG